MEGCGVDPRGDHLRQVGMEVAIAGVLHRRLLAGAGHHQAGGRQGVLFGGDAPVHGVVLVELVRVLPQVQQPPSLFPTQGMTGEHKRNAQTPLQLCPHPAGIGVVGVDPVRAALLAGDVQHQPVDELLQVGPEQLLAQVPAWAEGQPQQAGAGMQRLALHRVVRADPAVLDAAGDHLQPIHLGLLGQGPRQLEHVGGLATGVGITPQLQIVATDQAMQMQMEQIQTHAQEIRPTGVPTAYLRWTAVSRIRTICFRFL